MTEQQTYKPICPACGRGFLVYMDGKIRCMVCGYISRKENVDRS